MTNICGTGTTTRAETISPAPVVAAISGATFECAGNSITLGDATTGGVWTSNNPSIATVGSTDGNVTGVTAGSTTINYIYTGLSGCSITLSVPNTVVALPAVAAITGTAHTCSGTTSILSDATAGGVWGSMDPTVATVSSTGTVTAVATGTTTILYSVTSIAGCTAASSVTWTTDAGPAVAPITGTANECAGSTTTLTDAATGGTWSSSAPGTATVAGGVVTGIAAGTATIGYTITDGSTGCSSTATIINTVNALPSAGAITGTTTICAGVTTTLTDGAAGGTWSATDPTIATVSTTGDVTGVAAGSVNINYTVTGTGGCTATTATTVTVNTSPSVAAIMGTTDQCMGTTATLADMTSGGTWSSSNPAVATINPSTGLLTAVSAGTTVISYSITGGTFGCTGAASVTETVSTVPVHTAITGTTNTCAGNSTTLSSTATGGVWSSRSTAIATVSSTGDVTGIAAGSTYIYYTVSNACGSVRDSALVTVHGLPSAGTITALFTSVCAGSEVNLTESVTGGTWSTADASIATVTATGVVTGITAGTTTINYSVTNTSGCLASAGITITVGPALPTATIIPNSATICHGHAITMSVTATAGVTYQWLRNGTVITGATGDTYTTTGTGNYSVIISNGICSQTVTGATITAAPTPIITFIAPNELETGSFATYQWFKNGVAISGGNSRIITESGAGHYLVVVSDATGCTDTSAIYTVTGGTGTGNVGVSTTNTDENIIIYPNPASSELHVEVPQSITTAISIRILSMDGRVVIGSTENRDINVSHLANGVYLVQVYDTTGLLIKTAKFTKTE